MSIGTMNETQHTFMREGDVETLEVRSGHETVSSPVSCRDGVKPWGRLFSMSQYFPTQVLTRNAYAVGRLEQLDIVIQPPFPSDQTGLQMFNELSRTQFQITRRKIGDVFVVEITDRSRNGTYLNGIRLARDIPTRLPHVATISFLPEKIDAFVFYDMLTAEAPTNFVPAELSRDYVFCKKLGSGAFGEVSLAFCTDSGKPVAVKVCLRKTLPPAPNTDQFQPKYTAVVQAVHEATILQSIQHPCIVRVLKFYEHPLSVCVVMEYVGGGDLFDRILKMKRLPENLSKYIFYQIALAVQFLHNKYHTTHRDIKPENILLSCADSSYPVAKLCDFGLAATPHSIMRTCCGTPMYLAPEVLRHPNFGTYSNTADIWSMGCVLFTCLGGYTPFAAERHDMNLYEQVRTCNYVIWPDYWNGVSLQAQDFIKILLTVDQIERPRIDAVLRHPWLHDDAQVKQDITTHVFSGVSIEYHWKVSWTTPMPPVKRPALPNIGTPVRPKKRMAPPPPSPQVPIVAALQMPVRKTSAARDSSKFSSVKATVGSPVRAFWQSKIATPIAAMRTQDVGHKIRPKVLPMPPSDSGQTSRKAEQDAPPSKMSRLLAGIRG